MFAIILLVAVRTLSWFAGAVAVAFFVGAALGYAFRGKEHAAISSLGQDIKKKL